MRLLARGPCFWTKSAIFPWTCRPNCCALFKNARYAPWGNERLPLHARIIAATNRDLESAIRTGGFRQDLYFRLNVVTIKLPPLRERRSDIPLLVSAFLEKFSDPDKPTLTISEDAMRRLIAYDWPGNVRELENAVERSVALSSGPTLNHADLPTNIQYGQTDSSSG